MKRYEVLITGQASMYVTVEANNKDEAECIGENKFRAALEKTLIKVRLGDAEAYEVGK